MFIIIIASHMEAIVFSTKPLAARESYSMHIIIILLILIGYLYLLTQNYR